MRNRRIGVGAVLAILICTACILAGCRPIGEARTILADTPFYLSGPQQARPPDGILTAGTRVTLLREAGSYSLVLAPDGKEAYVATDALK